ncbi:hypothetical protein PMKS-000982 [Pichia membranifaciens]|uniref:Uncharacterized protein n=1 Tax=Pichia membranifaciens TaxID=4926 RepID=A0A1Q2YDA9_9ASCO|nr:hypothetical protein PMKS-000982 [Pichia membranifaciens]
MAVHSFWIFNRHTLCVFHREYNHQTAYKPQVSAATGSGASGTGAGTGTGTGTGAGAGAGTDKAVRLYPGRVNVLNDSNESKLLYVWKLIAAQQQQQGVHPQHAPLQDADPGDAQWPQDGRPHGCRPPQPASATPVRLHLCLGAAYR